MSIDHITTMYLHSSLSQDTNQHASSKEVVSPPKDTASKCESDSKLRSYSESQAEQRNMGRADVNRLESKNSRTLKLRAQLANVARIMSYDRAPGKP